MSSITVPLPDEDLAFLRAWSERRGTSAEALLALQARSLREHLESPLPPDVEAASGIISTDIDAEEAYREYIEKKHA